MDNISNNFIEVTETAGDEVAPHQVARATHRYSWAKQFCKDKDVLEIACGSGQGAQMIAEQALFFCGVDCCADLIKTAAVLNPKITFIQADAINLPFKDGSKDIIIFFEAIYYIQYIDKVMTECKRVLREDGKLLITSTNKDLFDFHKSDYCYKYFGANELFFLLSKHKFLCKISGVDNLAKLSFMNQVVRFIKYIAETVKLIPKAMSGKKWIKKNSFWEISYNA